MLQYIYIYVYIYTYIYEHIQFSIIMQRLANTSLSSQSCSANECDQDTKSS